MLKATTNWVEGPIGYVLANDGNDTRMVFPKSNGAIDADKGHRICGAPQEHRQSDSDGASTEKVV